ncbi:MAG: hypothetical protein ACRDVM_09620, partial [Acidimicrobiia bacterium]
MVDVRVPAQAVVASLVIEPHLFVIFGATGDLTRRKLLPAFHSLLRCRQYSDHCRVLGVATQQLTDDQYRRLAGQALTAAGIDDTSWCDHIHYQAIGEGFEALAKRIADLEAEHRLPGNRAFYLALPPSSVPETVDGLGGVG